MRKYLRLPFFLGLATFKGSIWLLTKYLIQRPSLIRSGTSYECQFFELHRVSAVCGTVQSKFDHSV